MSGPGVSQKLFSLRFSSRSCLRSRSTATRMPPYCSIQRKSIARLIPNLSQTSSSVVPASALQIGIVVCFSPTDSSPPVRLPALPGVSRTVNRPGGGSSQGPLSGESRVEA